MNVIERCRHAWKLGRQSIFGASITRMRTPLACKLVADLGRDGWLDHTSVDPEDPGSGLDVRSLCLIRETLARFDGLADFAFAMQGLGTGAISLFGTDAQKRKWLPKTRAGEALSAFALSEPRSGSDVANMDLGAGATVTTSC